MLLSAEIFASLFESSLSSSYKLPTRFQQLSSLFESAGMPDEAIAALGFVFWCASAIIEIAHIELCGVVSSMRKRLK